MTTSSDDKVGIMTTFGFLRRCPMCETVVFSVNLNDDCAQAACGYSDTCTCSCETASDSISVNPDQEMK